jgi:hypothetical protein
VWNVFGFNFFSKLFAESPGVHTAHLCRVLHGSALGKELFAVKLFAMKMFAVSALPRAARGKHFAKRILAFVVSIGLTKFLQS